MKPILKLAIPVMLSQVGLTVMILVDTYMVGKLGSAAIGGVGIGSVIFFGLILFATGCLLALDPLVAQAFGKGDKILQQQWLVQGTQYALFLSVLLMVTYLILSMRMAWFGVDPALQLPAELYLRNLAFCVPFFLIFFVFRQYLAAQGIVQITTVIMVFANIVNYFFNWILIFGNWGFPRLEVVGAAHATLYTRLLMAAALIFIVLRREPDCLKQIRGPEREKWKTLARIGLPAGAQMLIRAGFFSVVGVVVGTLGATEGAAHTIVLNLTSTAYMIPIGIGAAAAVLVGQSVGKKDFKNARTSGWRSITFASAIAVGCGLLFFFFGEFLVSLFSQDPKVIQLGSKLLKLAALIEIADSLQTVSIGALRGWGETRSPMWASLLGYWGIALPLAFGLVFGLEWGIEGIWAGFGAGLIAATTLVLPAWVRQSRSVSSPLPTI